MRPPRSASATFGIGVAGVEDVVLEVAADLDLVERDLLIRESVSAGKLRLGDRVVLELQVGIELHELGPVGARARTALLLA